MGVASKFVNFLHRRAFPEYFAALPDIPFEKGKISDLSLNEPDFDLTGPESSLKTPGNCRENEGGEHPTDDVFPYTPGSV